MKPLHVCRFLQNKAYFMISSATPQPEERAPGTPFWCATTHEAVGPDGKDVRDDRCLKGRGCYRAQVDL